MQIIDGKQTSAEIRAEIRAQTAALAKQYHRQPHLAVILAGDNGASVTYVANKERACREAGFTSQVLRYPADVAEAELLAAIDTLNRSNEVDGFIVQLPLPPQIDEQKIITAIDPRKDVDGFHPINLGRMAIGAPACCPATPAGIAELLRRYAIPTDGKHCVILGRSNIVGRPMSILLSQKEFNCTVTLCHSHTANIKDYCLQADILIAAMGQPDFVTADMVKRGAAVIDVGTTRVTMPDSARGYCLKGDVKFEEVAPLCSYITPVPGGVGPMTIAALLKNTLAVYKANICREY